MPKSKRNVRGTKLSELATSIRETREARKKWLKNQRKARLMQYMEQNDANPPATLPSEPS